jgi:mRNA interferase MazF
MKRAGQIALTPFPNTDLSGAKRRPVLLIRQASSRFDDWLVCMVSSQLHQAETGFDEIIITKDLDFAGSGLKAPSNGSLIKKSSYTSCSLLRHLVIILIKRRSRVSIVVGS